MAKSISMNRIRSEMKNAGSNEYLGSFPSKKALCDQYPERVGDGHNKKKDELVGGKVFNDSSYAIIDDGNNPPVQMKYNSKGRWVQVGSGSGGVSSHQLLSDLQGGESPDSYYHLTKEVYDNLISKQTDVVYVGDKDTPSSWKITRVGMGLEFSRYENDAYHQIYIIENSSSTDNYYINCPEGKLAYMTDDKKVHTLIKSSTDLLGVQVGNIDGRISLMNNGTLRSYNPIGEVKVSDVVNISEVDGKANATVLSTYTQELVISDNLIIYGIEHYYVEECEPDTTVRVFITDKLTGNILSQNCNRSLFVNNMASPVVKGVNKISLSEPLAILKGKDIILNVAFTKPVKVQGMNKTIGTIPQFYIRWDGYVQNLLEQDIATKDYARNIILNKNDNIHITSDLSYGAIPYQLNLLRFTMPEGIREPSVYEERGDQLLYFYGDYTIPKDKKISMEIREINPLHKKSRITLFFEVYQQNGYFETVKMEKSLVNVISEKGLNLRQEVTITKHSEGHVELYCAFDFEVGDNITLDFLEGTQFSNSRAFFRLREETLETTAECVDEMFSEYGTFKENLIPDSIAKIEDMRTLYERVSTLDLSNGDNTMIRVGYSSSDFVRLAKCSLAPNTVEYEVGNAKYDTPESVNYKGVYATKYGANSNIDSDYILTRINNLGQADVYEFDKAVQFDYMVEWEGSPPTIVLDTINLIDNNGNVLKQNKDLYVEGNIAIIRFVVYELTYNFGLEFGIGNDLSNCNATANWVMKNMEFSETPLFDQNNTIDPIFNNGRMREAVLYRSKDTKAPAINYESPLFGKSPVISMSDGSGYGINVGSFMSDITFNTNSTTGLSVSALEEMIQFPIETAVNNTNMTGIYTKQFTLTGIDKKNIVLGLVFATFYDSRIEVAIRDGSSREIFRRQFQLFSQGDNSAYAIFSQSTSDKFMIGNGLYTLEVKVLEGHLIGGEFPRTVLVHGKATTETLALNSTIVNTCARITPPSSFIMSPDGETITAFSPYASGIELRVLEIPKNIGFSSIKHIGENVFRYPNTLMQTEEVKILSTLIESIHEGNFRDIGGTQMCKIYAIPNTITYATLLTSGYSVIPLELPISEPSKVLSTNAKNELIWADVSGGTDVNAIHKYANLTKDFKTMFDKSGLYRCYGMEENLPPNYEVGNNDFYAHVYYTDTELGFITLEVLDIRSNRRFTLSMKSHVWGEWFEHFNGNSFSELKLIGENDGKTILPSKITSETPTSKDIPVLSITEDKVSTINIGSFVSDLNLFYSDENSLNINYMSKHETIDFTPFSSTPLGIGKYSKRFQFRESDYIIRAITVGAKQPTKMNFQLLEEGTGAILFEKMCNIPKVMPATIIISDAINTCNIQPANYEIVVEIISGELVGTDFPTMQIEVGFPFKDRIIPKNVAELQLITHDRMDRIKVEKDIIIGYDPSLNNYLESTKHVIYNNINGTIVRYIGERVFNEGNVNNTDVWEIEADLNDIHPSNFRDNMGNQLCKLIANPNTQTYHILKEQGYEVYTNGRVLEITERDMTLETNSQGEMQWIPKQFKDNGVYLTDTMRIVALENSFVFQIKIGENWQESGRMGL